MIKRLIYIGYYITKLDKKKFSKFLNFTVGETGKVKLRILYNVILSSVRYNISLLDFFYFRFYEKSNSERKKWAGTGFMYEYQLEMNPKNTREILENKIKFLNHFKEFVNRKFVGFDDQKPNLNEINKLLSNSTRKIVLKNALGQVGSEIEIINCNDFTTESLINYMHKRKYNLIEEFVVQHNALMDLSPSGLNTIRVMTQVKNGNVDFLGARLRVSVNSHVDNLAAGNLAAPICIETGIVSGPGVYSDITRQDEKTHPVTGVALEDFQVPFWKETINLVTKVALMTPENRSIGWDIAITSEGPEIIEGNHNWCKLLWQLPVKKGLKHMLLKYEVELNY